MIRFLYNSSLIHWYLFLFKLPISMRRTKEHETRWDFTLTQNRLYIIPNTCFPPLHRKHNRIRRPDLLPLSSTHTNTNSLSLSHFPFRRHTQKDFLDAPRFLSLDSSNKDAGNYPWRAHPKVVATARCGGCQSGDVALRCGYHWWDNPFNFLNGLSLRLWYLC